MLERTKDDVDAAIITLAARVYDLAECDLDVPDNSERLRSTTLALLRSLDERGHITAEPVNAV